MYVHTTAWRKPKATTTTRYGPNVGSFCWLQQQQQKNDDNSSLEIRLVHDISTTRERETEPGEMGTSSQSGLSFSLLFSLCWNFWKIANAQFSLRCFVVVVVVSFLWDYTRTPKQDNMMDCRVIERDAFVIFFIFQKIWSLRSVKYFPTFSFELNLSAAKRFFVVVRDDDSPTFHQTFCLVWRKNKNE